MKINNITFNNNEIVLIPRKYIYKNNKYNDIVYICSKCLFISGNLGIIIHNINCNNYNRTINLCYNNTNVLNSFDKSFLFCINKNKIIKDKVIEELKYILLSKIVNKILYKKLNNDVNNIIINYL